jgi:hypothetical protein
MRWQLAATCLIAATAGGCDPGVDLSILGGPYPLDEEQFDLYVAVRTTGEAVDDGYLLTVAQVVNADSVVTLSEVWYGHRQPFQTFSYPAPFRGAVLDVLVGLSDIALNCTVSEQNPLQFQLQTEWQSHVEFTVTCVRPPLPKRTSSLMQLPFRIRLTTA